MISVRHAFLMLTWSALAAGCSAVVDAGRAQCSTDADCTKRGATFAASTCVESFCQVTDPWSCVAHPPISGKSGGTVDVDFSLFDAVKMTSVEGVESAVCGKLDLECTSPVLKVKTDANGSAHFSMPTGFDGYVQLSAEGYDSTMIFLPPATENVSLGRFPLTTMVATAVLGGQLGKPLLPGTGRVLMTVTGCDKQTVAGVTLTGENMGQDAQGFYATGGLPSFSASETDDSGFAGFVNVSPGQIAIDGTLGDGRHVGKIALFVRAGTVSVRRLQPWTD